jgi:hypothetical protein
MTGRFFAELSDGSLAQITTPSGLPDSNPSVSHATEHAAMGNVVTLATNPVTGRITFSASPNLPFNLAQSNVPTGIAPSGSTAGFGALNLGTTLPTTYSGGIWLRFPAGAVFTGSLATVSYWCVMSSTTIGTVYANTLTGVPTVPAVLIPITDATNIGAYTGVTTTQTLCSCTVWANCIGLNGNLFGTFSSYNNNSAGTKIARFVLGAVGLGGATLTTATEQAQDITFRNLGVASKNFLQYRNYAAAFGMASAQGLTIDTSADQALIITGVLNTATDYLIVQGMMVTINPL